MLDLEKQEMDKLLAGLIVGLDIGTTTIKVYFY